MAPNPNIEARAQALEHLLLAPCCWQQTLDIHHSELADALHGEIRLRLMRGESTGTIEQDLVQRFGDKLVAVPAPFYLEGTALAVMLVLVLSGACLWRMAHGWSRRLPASAADADQRYDDALDRALRDFERRS